MTFQDVDEARANAVRRHLREVEERIRAAAARYGRAASEITLLAVSKTQPAAAIRAAYAAGQRSFGENYVQEALTKIGALAGLGCEWHFIGPLQSNKSRAVAENFDWLHSLDRERLARRLSEQRPPARAPLDVCIQVNVSGESSKSGVAPADVPALARAVADLPRLRLRGLMAIPAPASAFDEQRAAFAALRELGEQLRVDGIACDTLSMGMTADLEAAIAEGATIVRVGTAIFGPRPARAPA